MLTIASKSKGYGRRDGGIREEKQEILKSLWVCNACPCVSLIYEHA